MIRVLKELLLLQWRSSWREPEVLFWALAFPAILSGLLGLAFKNKGNQALPIVFIASNSSEMQGAQDILKTLDPKTLLTVTIQSEDQARLSLKRGSAVLAVFSSWDSQTRHFLFDPANAEGELAYYRAKAGFAQVKSGNDADVLDARGSRYIDFVLPGLFAYSVINSCLWGIGWVIIDYRQKKFLRRMVATPLKKWHYFLALLIGRMGFLAVEFGTLYGFSRYFFDVQIQGSVLAFTAVMLSGMLAFFGLACLIAARTSNPQVGIGLINATTLPMFVISGIFFSYERFPAAVQPILRHFPPTMMVDSLRSIMNEGSGLLQATPTCFALGVMGLVCLVCAQRMFRWY